MIDTKFGRYQVAEAPSAIFRMHMFSGQTVLKVQDWEPKIAVLDQEDLLAQGIQCSSFIPGATDVDALGSCTANATAAAISNLLPQPQFLQVTKAASYDDTVNAEKWAISFYHQCTDETGDPSQEWPPQDCGSSGPYIVQQLQHLGLAGGDVLTTGGMNLMSLMQTGGLLVGQPWFNNWMTPDAQGFIDSAGITADMASGLAGGHETFWSAIESIALTPTGNLIPERTVCRGRNSWTKSWGDNGSYRFHLSTYLALANYCDFRALTPVVPPTSPA